MHIIKSSKSFFIWLVVNSMVEVYDSDTELGGGDGDKLIEMKLY